MILTDEEIQAAICSAKSEWNNGADHMNKWPDISWDEQCELSGRAVESAVLAKIANGQEPVAGISQSDCLWARNGNRPCTADNPCGCHDCQPNTGENMRMILCSDCGNKRCPKAQNHRNACTNSNAVGQPGSAYP